MKSPAIAGLILSGGASRRMGQPKALLDIQGETFLDRLIGVFVPVCRPVIVALGHGSTRIREGIARGGEAVFVVNPDPERGMFSSLQCGLREVPQSAESLIFTPVDYPSIHAATVRKLAQAFEQWRRPVTMPRHLGCSGHPVCISRVVMDELLSLPASAQARDVIRSYAEQTCWVDVDDPGIAFDIDSPEDYRILRAQRAALETQ